MSGPSVLKVEGSLEAMGAQHGEGLRGEIQRLAAQGIDVVCASDPRLNLSAVQRAAEEIESEIARQVPQVYEETKSIANAANIECWRLIMAGLYSDVQNRAVGRSASRVIRDGCTLLPAITTPEGVLLAGAWDSRIAEENEILILERRPTQGPWTLTVSTAGWPMRHGVTSYGIGYAGTSTIADRSQRGIPYIAALLEIARAKDIVSAATYISTLNFCSACFCSMADSLGLSLGIEADAEQYFMGTVSEIYSVHPYSGKEVVSPGRMVKLSSGSEVESLSHRPRNVSVNSLSLLQMLNFDEEPHESASRGQAHPAPTRTRFVLNPYDLSIILAVGTPGMSEPCKYRLGA